MYIQCCVKFGVLVVNMAFFLASAGVFLQWIGLTLRMALVPMASRTLYWDSSKYDMELGFNKTMSRDKWTCIWTALECPPPPSELDPAGGVIDPDTLAWPMLGSQGPS